MEIQQTNNTMIVNSCQILCTWFVVKSICYCNSVQTSSVTGVHCVL